MNVPVQREAAALGHECFFLEKLGSQSETDGYHGHVTEVSHDRGSFFGVTTVSNSLASSTLDAISLR